MADRLSHEELCELVMKAKGGDIAARNRVVECNLGLVGAVVRHYKIPGVPQQELAQEGHIGLIRAAEDFRPELGNRFSTYARWWIRNAIQRYLRDRERIVRIPTNVLVKMKAARRAAAELGFNIEDGTEAACRAAGLSETQTEMVRCGLRCEGHFPDGEFDDIVDHRGGTDDDAGEMIAAVMGAIDGLREPHRRVVTLYYGLGEEGPLSYSEIAARVGLSESQCSKIGRQAIDMIRLVVCGRDVVPDGRWWPDGDMTDDQWRAVSVVIPSSRRRLRVSVRSVVDAIAYRARTGCHADKLPARYPKPYTVHHYRKTWLKDGTMFAIQNALRNHTRGRAS